MKLNALFKVTYDYYLISDLFFNVILLKSNIFVNKYHKIIAKSMTLKKIITKNISPPSHKLKNTVFIMSLEARKFICVRKHEENYPFTWSDTIKVLSQISFLKLLSFLL